MKTISLTEIAQILDPYKLKIERAIEDNLHTLCSETVLREACQYAVLNGGKRFRPALVLMIAETLGLNRDVMHVALAVEYFHTASLIADDLPCMDNDDMRRNKPSVHKVYGEAVALLSSYVLISAGYERLAKAAEHLKLSGVDNSDRLCVLALQNVSSNTGIQGTTGGQFLDMYSLNYSLVAVEEVIYRKTVSLFEISFVLGWLFGGGNIDQIEQVKKAAYHFGMAFQIADDYDDAEEDAMNKRLMNMVSVVGEEKGKNLFLEQIEAFQLIAAGLNLKSDAIYALIQILKERVIPLIVP